MGKEDRRGGEEDDRPEQNHWGHCSTLRPEWEDRAGCQWFISIHYLPWNILLEHINEAKGKKNIQERDKVMKMGFTSVWGSWSERQQRGTWNVFFNLQLFNMVREKDWLSNVLLLLLFEIQQTKTMLFYITTKYHSSWDSRCCTVNANKCNRGKDLLCLTYLVSFDPLQRGNG